MQTEEGKQLDNLLTESMDEFRASLAGLTDQNAARKPNPDCWSALDIVEHVAFVENIFSRRIAENRFGSEDLTNPERESTIFDRVSSRETPISAPAASHPQGKFQTVAAALDNLKQVRVFVHETLASKESKLRFLPVQHPFFGILNGYEAFLILAAHMHRHARQITEYRTLLEKSTLPVTA